MSSPLCKIHSGSGRISVALHAGKAVISDLACTYPLKLLSPSTHNDTAMVYMMTYGGGLVGGDAIDLNVNVEAGAKLVLLSQGTTKVFKTRIERRLATTVSQSVLDGPTSTQPSLSTKQNLHFRVGEGAILMVLPEPVTCFRDASYAQTQTFSMKNSGSVVVLDWITSGRMAMGEEWLFSRYYSGNEIFRDDRRIAKDVMLLDTSGLGKSIPDRTLKDRLAPYGCYAMLFLSGPHLCDVITAIKAEYAQITVFKTKEPAELIWSFSHADSTVPGQDGQAVVVRVAARTTELVKEWLKETLKGLEKIIGREVYRRAFP